VNVRLLVLVLMFASAASAEMPLAERRSGYEFMGRETRAMQDDNATNPGMLWVLDGEALWRRKAGAADKACEDCHGVEKMKGVAARYPAVQAGRLLNLDQRINLCRVKQQKASAFAFEGRELLSLSAYIGVQSRGLPIAIERTPQNEALLEAGRSTFFRRQGQLNLACAQCHDQNWGKSLAGSTIPQAHPTGYPIYRLEWQNLGSLQRRLRNCMIGVRAEPYAYGAQEYVELELYLMWRARGMKLETPAVRP
jgi:sulfur-oxidizing protein SoxA